MNALPPKIRAVAEEFRQSPVGQELHDPSKASGRCKPAALVLLGLVSERGCEGQLLSYARPGEHHYVVRVGDLVLDPSSRQFDDAADVPAIRTVAEMHVQWGAPTAVNLKERWDQLTHKVPSSPPNWSSARESLPPRPPGFNDPQ